MTADQQRIDVVGQKVGNIYAQALYGAAEASGDPAGAIAELSSLVTDILDVFPDFERVLASQMVRTKDKKAVIDRSLTGRLSPLILDFLKVLAERERLGYLRPILFELRELHRQRTGRVRVDVTTAASVDDDHARQLKDVLRKMLSGEPDLVMTVDPKLIGGVLLRVGDTVYDGSVAAELERMRAAIQMRNVAEIDKNRERFQYTSSKL